MPDATLNSILLILDIIKYSDSPINLINNLIPSEVPLFVCVNSSNFKVYVLLKINSKT